MAQQGAALQTYNNELVSCLEELSKRRKQLQQDIEKEEQEKQQLENKMGQLRAKLDRVNADLQLKLETRDKYDKTLHESEQAYLKILESSQVLLNVVKRDFKALEISKKNTNE